jgi:hypothetical protein
MPKKKAGAFNAMQIKDGWIVRMSKDGRILEKIDRHLPRHPKKVV